MAHISFLYHIVWRTKCSERTIVEAHERDLYAYIMGICNAKKCHLYRINGMPDHIHMLVAVHPQIAVSEFMKVLKGETSKWLKENPDFPDFRGWGEGYAGFTYSIKEKDTVFQYIKNQKVHHHVKSFAEEYREFLIENGLNPDDDLFLKD